MQNSQPIRSGLLLSCALTRALIRYRPVFAIVSFRMVGGNRPYNLCPPPVTFETCQTILHFQSRMLIRRDHPGQPLDCLFVLRLVCQSDPLVGIDSVIIEIFEAVLGGQIDCWMRYPCFGIAVVIEIWGCIRTPGTASGSSQ